MNVADGSRAGLHDADLDAADLSVEAGLPDSGRPGRPGPGHKQSVVKGSFRAVRPSRSSLANIARCIAAGCNSRPRSLIASCRGDRLEPVITQSALPVVPRSMESVSFHRQIMPVSAPPNRSSAGPIVDSPSGTSRLCAGWSRLNNIQRRQGSPIMNRLIWLVGAVVIVLFSIGHFDLR